MTTPVPWTKLLGHVYEDVGDEYGAHTQEVWSAFAAMREAKWLEHVGEPIESASQILPVASWEEAITIFARQEGTGYGPNGHLIEPVARARAALEDPTTFAQWQRARIDARKYAAYRGYVPDWMDGKTLPNTTVGWTYDEAVGEYLYEFVSWLLAEIIGGAKDCTYFREQLSWFHAGHFPCGWEGTWPLGRMRVY
jgi:hypothetical protein